MNIQNWLDRFDRWLGGPVEPMKPYLIQRCKMKKDVKDSDVTGWDSAFSNDYMGSAEFEFGALSKALKEILPNLGKYEIYDDKQFKAKDGRGVFIFCTPEQKDQLPAIISDSYHEDEQEVRQRAGRKERTMFKYAIDCAEGYGSDMNVWWDIENHYFFSLGKPAIQQVKLALTRLKEKWKKEGKI